MTVGIEKQGSERVEERWTRGIVGHGTRLDEQREQGVNTLGDARCKIQLELTHRDLKLSLRECVE